MDTNTIKKLASFAVLFAVLVGLTACDGEEPGELGVADTGDYWQDVGDQDTQGTEPDDSASESEPVHADENGYFRVEFPKGLQDSQEDLVPADEDRQPVSSCSSADWSTTRPIYNSSGVHAADVTLYWNSWCQRNWAKVTAVGATKRKLAVKLEWNDIYGYGYDCKPGSCSPGWRKVSSRTTDQEWCPESSCEAAAVGWVGSTDYWAWTGYY